MHVWGEDDIIRFLDAAKATPYYALFYAALFTGMRRSELLGLRWKDTDLDLAQLSVTQTLHRLASGGFVFREPKTGQEPPHNSTLAVSMYSSS